MKVIRLKNKMILRRNSVVNKKDINVGDKK